MSIKLGDKVRDTITGYSGIVICRTDWLFGCVRFGVQAVELNDGKPVEYVCFDEPQLEVIKPEPSAKTPPMSGGKREDEKRAMSRNG